MTFDRNTLQRTAWACTAGLLGALGIFAGTAAAAQQLDTQVEFGRASHVVLPQFRGYSLRPDRDAIQVDWIDAHVEILELGARTPRLASSSTSARARPCRSKSAIRGPIEPKRSSCSRSPIERRSRASPSPGSRRVREGRVPSCCPRTRRDVSMTTSFDASRTRRCSSSSGRSSCDPASFPCRPAEPRPFDSPTSTCSKWTGHAVTTTWLAASRSGLECPVESPFRCAASGRSRWSIRRLTNSRLSSATGIRCACEFDRPLSGLQDPSGSPTSWRKRVSAPP